MKNEVEQGRSQRHTRAIFHKFSVALVCATLFLLLAGALVTSNEAGDSVPDWPLSFGRWIIGSDQFTANVRYEYSHRVIAGAVGTLTVALAVWTLMAGWASKKLRRLALVAAGVVVLQALIGGVRVLFPALKPQIAVPHALIAQSFFCLVIALAIVTSSSWREPRPRQSDGRSLRRIGAATVAAVLIQLVLGAAFRHGAIGIIPHIIGATAVTVLIVLTAVRTRRSAGSDPYLSRPAAVAVLLLVIQLILGVLAYLARLASKSDPQPLEPMISLTAAHVVVGALTLAAVLVTAMRLHQILEPAAPAGKDRSKLSAYVDLTKPRITMLVVLTAAAGFCLAARGGIDYAALANLTIGVLLLSSGISALNQYLEREVDGLMLRTKSRPLPSRRLSPIEALLFGLALSIAATFYLLIFVNVLTGVLGLATLVSYLFGYTPLKTRSTLSTVIGALPGAMPPLIGWTGARGQITIEPLILFAILFLWQFPHFLAIAWMYKEDYARAGIKMLPVVEPDGRVTSRQIVSYTMMLLPASLLPVLANLAGQTYLAGALVLGVLFLYFSVRASIFRTRWEARRLLMASVIYLPALFGLMVVGR